MRIGIVFILSLLSINISASHLKSEYLIPNAPSNLSLTGITSSSIELSWQDNSLDELGFRVERSLNPGGPFSSVHVTLANVNTWTDTGLEDDTHYYYRVSAFDLTSTSGFASANATTLLAAPDAPTGLSLGGETTSSIDLTWTDNSDNETGFLIERRTGLTSYTQVGTTSAGVNQFTDTGLEDNTVFYYRVRATNSAGPSGYSNVSSTTTLLAIPDTPSGLALGNETTSSIDLTWTDNSDNETGFLVERRTGLTSYAQVGTTSAGVNQFTDTGLEDNTVYYYKVRATNSAGESDYSNEASTSTLLAIPEAPDNLALSGETSSSIDLTWEDLSDNETGFLIERRTSVTSFAQVGITVADIPTFTDTGLEEDTRYFYRVRATNDAGESGYSNTESTNTLLAPPLAPTDLNVGNATVNSLELTWTDNASNESGYLIERRTETTSFVQVATTTINIVLYTDTGLEDNTTYYYRVRSTNATGESDYSNEANGTTLLDVPVAPTILQGTATSICEVNLTWQDNADSETGFVIQRSGSFGSGYALLAQVGADVETYVDTSANNNSTYYYRIYALNTAGNSLFSNTAMVQVAVVLNGGIIGSDQSICPEGDPLAISNLSPPSGGGGAWAYQWQSRTLIGTFTNITGAAGLSYDPPVGLSQTTLYQRVSSTECGVVISNAVTITPEDIEPPVFDDCPNDTVIQIDRNETSAVVDTRDPVVLDNCEIVSQTWSLSGATVANSPATGLHFLGSYEFNLGTTVVTYQVEDIGGHIVQCQFEVLLELKDPEILQVSIPDIPMKIEDVVTVTITVGNDGDLASYELVSGTVGGYLLNNFERVNTTTYLANFVIVEGGTSYTANQNIPVTNLVITDGVNPSLPYNLPINQNNDPIDASRPDILSMTTSPGVYGIGELVTITIRADGPGYTLHSGSTLNDMALSPLPPSVTFSEMSSGYYRLNYLVQEGDTDVQAGEFKATILLMETSGNFSTPDSIITNADLVTIDANPPVVTQMEVPDAEIGVGKVVQLTISADGAEYVASTGTVINGIPLSSPRVTFYNRGLGLYELSYIVAEEDANVDPGNLAVQLVLEDLAGNVSLPFTEISQNELEVYTKLPIALLAGTPEICEGEYAELSIFLDGRGPMSFDLYDGKTVNTYENISLETLILTVTPSENTTYSIMQVRDVNEVVNTGSGDVQVTVNQKAEVEINNLKPAYNVNDSPVQLEANIPGGIFTGPGVFSGGIFDPGVADTVNSPHTLVYTYENDNGCVSVDSALVYVIGAQGAIVIPSDLICSDIGPFEVNAYNAIDATGTFRLLDETGQAVNGLTDNGDNTATVDPGLLTDGIYTIDYQYVDQVVLKIQRSFTVESITTPVITNLDAERYCQNFEPFILESDQPDAIFEGPGVTLTEEGYLFSPVDVTPGEVLIKCTMMSAGGCEATSQKLVTIDFAPEADFRLSATCIDEAGGTVGFSNMTNDKLQVETWSWDFGDPESGEDNQSNLVSPEHYYAGPGVHAISLTATTASGCVSYKEMTVDLGNRPVADFTWSSDCYREEAGIDFMNRSVSESNPFDTLVWRFRTDAGVLIDEIGYRTGSDTLNYPFPELANYNVELFAMNAVGCADSISYDVRLRETVQMQEQEFMETFDQNNGQWTVDSEDQTASWMWAEPDFTGFQQVQGDRAWFTSLPDDVIDYEEHSWVQSPCFDFSGMKRPMIQLDIMKSLVPTRDGAVLQYQVSKEEGWNTLGEPGSGINWYNGLSLTQRPGGNEWGWSLDYFPADQTWMRAVHGLDEVAGERSVTFRIAIGTGGSEPGYGNQGFAFDNVTIGERSKLVLLEHFTNSSDIASRTADDEVDRIAAEERGNLVDLQYHMSYPGEDPMNENNPAPPSTRSFNNGIPQVPYAVVDGGMSEEYRYDFSDLKATPNQDHLNLLSLKAPLFDVKLNVNWMESALEVRTTVNCKTDRYDENIQLYVVVMETSVTAYTGLNGDEEFRNVVLDMLPNANGRLIGDNWRTGDSVTQLDNWIYQPYVEDPEELAVVAFVQDRISKEILQTAASYRSPQVGIGNTPASIENLLLYPNPGKSIVNVNLGREAREEGRLVVFDMNGRMVRQQVVPPGYQIHQMNINDLERGIYLIQWFEGQKLMARGKLVKVD